LGTVVAKLVATSPRAAVTEARKSGAGRSSGSRWTYVRRVEAGLGVPEELLHLDGVPAVTKEHRRACMPKCVEADPAADACLPRA
jgi:hypothetical protein